MREIKFRAWDKNKKKFVDAKSYFGWSSPWIHLMQYTGLKDKNGKEIYEGDILKLDSWTSNQQVVFDEGGFCLAGKDTGFTSDIHYIHHAGIPQATVIGNIYENPELLKTI